MCEVIDQHRVLALQPGMGGEWLQPHPEYPLRMNVVEQEELNQRECVAQTSVLPAIELWAEHPIDMNQALQFLRIGLLCVRGRALLAPGDTIYDEAERECLQQKLSLRNRYPKSHCFDPADRRSRS